MCLIILLLSGLTKHFIIIIYRNIQRFQVRLINTYMCFYHTLVYILISGVSDWVPWPVVGLLRDPLLPSLAPDADEDEV